LQRGLVREKLSQLNSAKSDLSKSLELLPTAPAYYTLGNIALKENDATAAKNYYAKVASNENDLGKKAAAAFARLDLNDNPQKYLAFSFLKSPDGVLVVEIKNQSPLSVKNLHISAKLLSVNGNLIAQESFQSASALRPGESRRWEARAIPLPVNLQNQKLTADITRVSIAE
jgi:hypothetical protein